MKRMLSDYISFDSPVKQQQASVLNVSFMIIRRVAIGDKCVVYVCGGVQLQMFLHRLDSQHV